MDFLRSSKKPHDEPAARRDAAPTRRSRTENLEQLALVLGQFVELSDTIGEPLSYEDVIGWFVRERPDGDIANSGAVLKIRRSIRRIDIIQVFLDEHQEPLRTTRGEFVGRRLAVSGIDHELSTAFGDTDLIIVI